MANLNNKQSTALFKAQSVTNAMLSDVAQPNANEQFNATSENQMTQFSSNLAAQVSQYNWLWKCYYISLMLKKQMQY